MALGARIRKRREDLGIDQKSLCAMVPGLTQQALSNLETRDSKTSEFALRIAAALNTSAAWLLDGLGRPEDRDWPFERINRLALQQLSHDDLTRIETALTIFAAQAGINIAGEATANPTSRVPVTKHAA